MGEVAAVLLWIVIGVVAIALLGRACSWVLKAQGGLEAMQYADSDAGVRAKADAFRLNADAVPAAAPSRTRSAVSDPF
jgi:hypothetical protein